MDKKNNHLQPNSSKEVQTFAKNTVTLYNSTLKIRDFNEDNKVFWTKTRMTLAKCSLMLGSKVAPTDEEYFILKETLIKSFKDFAPEEIVDAFDKLIAGKLNVEADKYGKITAAYLGQVLIAHREFRNKALAKELKDRSKEEHIATDEDKSQARANFLNKCLFKPYSEIKEKGFFDVDRFVAKQLYQIFLRANLFSVTDLEEEYFLNLAEKDLYNDAKKDHKTHKPILKHMESIKEMNSGKSNTMILKITERAAVLYFYEYILKLHKNNRDINEIAKQL